MTWAPDPGPDGKRRYGNFKIIEDPTRCIAQLIRNYEKFQCSNKRNIGDYCKTHDPATQQAKRDARTAAFFAEIDASKKRREKAEAIAGAERAVIEAARCVRSARQLAISIGDGEGYRSAIDVLCDAVAELEELTR